MLYVLLALAMCFVAFLMGVGYLRALRDQPFEKAGQLPQGWPSLAAVPVVTRAEPANAGKQPTGLAASPTQPERPGVAARPAADAERSPDRRSRLPAAPSLQRNLIALQFLSLFLLVFTGLLTLAVLGAGLIYLHQLRVAALVPSVAVASGWSAVGGALAALLLTVPLVPLETLALLRIILGRKRYTELFDYEYYRNKRATRSLKCMWLLLCAVFCLAAAALLVTTMNSYTRFEQNQVIIKSGISLSEKTYTYDRVTQIKLTDIRTKRDNQVVNGTLMEISFDDGYVWHCHADEFDLTDSGRAAAKRETLVQFLGEKTGKTVVHTREER